MGRAMWSNPSRVRLDRKLRAANPTTPVEPGRYYWSEWKVEVDVYRKKGGRRLFVKPPGGVEIEVTPNIAGTFKRVEAVS